VRPAPKVRRDPKGPPERGGPLGRRYQGCRLAIVDEQFTELRRRLDTQLVRTAQLQSEIDLQARPSLGPQLR
jgi:hypothetical protein